VSGFFSVALSLGSTVFKRLLMLRITPETKQLREAQPTVWNAAAHETSNTKQS